MRFSFEVLTELTMDESSAFWDTRLCSLVRVNRSVRGRHGLHFQGQRVREERYRCKAGRIEAPHAVMSQKVQILENAQGYCQGNVSNRHTFIVNPSLFDIFLMYRRHKVLITEIIRSSGRINVNVFSMPLAK
jgi:hypothetical protein